MGECICLASEDEIVTDNVNVNESAVAHGKLNADNNPPEPTEDLLIDIETMASNLRAEVEQCTNVSETVLTVERAEGVPVSGSITGPEKMVDGSNAKDDNVVRRKEGGKGRVQVSLPFSSLDMGSVDLIVPISETEASACALPPFQQDSVERPAEEEGTDMDFGIGSFTLKQLGVFLKQWKRKSIDTEYLE